MADVTAARIIIPVTTNASKATTAMGGLDKSIKKVEKSLKKNNTATNSNIKSFKNFANVVRGIAPIIGVAVLGRALQSSVKAASDLEEQTTKFLTVFRAVPLQAENMANELVTAYGLSRRESVQLLASTGDLLTGFGFTQQAALELSSSTQTLAADLASFNDIQGGAEEASRALTKGLLGEHESLKALGIIISEAGLKQELFVQGKDKLTGQALLQAKAEARLAIAIRQSANAIGDVARTQDSFANVQRRVIARTEDLKAAIGAELIPEVKKMGLAFLDAVGDGKSLGKQIGETIVLIISLVKTAVTAAKILTEVNPLTILTTGAKKALSGENPFEKIGDLLVEFGENTKAVTDLMDKQNETTVKSIALSSEVVVTEEKAIKTRKKTKKQLKDINAIRKEALSILAATGDLTSQLANQEFEFAEQRKTVAVAGLNVAMLEKFQAEQRLNIVRDFITRSTELENSTIAQREASLNEALFNILENENLSFEQRLAGQEAFNQASIALEQERMRQIVASVQFAANIASDVSSILQSFSQVQQNNMQAEINAMEERGASEEELAKKRKELAKKAARDQKIFGTISVIIDTATAVTRALLLLPNPAAFALAALAAAKGAAQLAVIQSTSTPAQFGGIFTIPPGAEADSGLVRVNQGEQVEVTPVRESGGQGPENITVMIGTEQIEAMLIDSMNRNLNNGSVQIRRGGVVKSA